MDALTNLLYDAYRRLERDYKIKCKELEDANDDVAYLEDKLKWLAFENAIMKGRLEDA